MRVGSEGAARSAAAAPAIAHRVGQGLFGANLGHLWHCGDLIREELGAIVKCVEDGTFTPVVDATFPFDQAADAHAYVQDRKNFGEVLFIP